MGGCKCSAEQPTVLAEWWVQADQSIILLILGVLTSLKRLGEFVCFRNFRGSKELFLSSHSLQAGVREAGSGTNSTADYALLLPPPLLK